MAASRAAPAPERGATAFEGASPAWEALCGALAEPGFWEAPVGPTDAAPFAELLAPLAAWAGRRLRERAGPAHARLSPEAVRTLEAGLLEGLAHWAAPCLYAEFAALRSAAQAVGGLPGRRGVHARFVARRRGAGMADFLTRAYPLLGRVLAVRLDRWIEAHAALLARLEADRDALAAAFGPWARVARLEPELSDPHHGGQTVCGLTLDNGRRILYKPRDLRLEVAFHELLGWAAARGADWEGAAFTVLPMEGYGWVERLESAWPAGPEQTRRFHRRNGMLLALLHALGSTDMHVENLLPTPEGYAVIDMETLLAPFAARRARLDAEGAWAAAQAFGIGVLHTGMLPGWQIQPDGAWLNVGALGRGGPLPQAVVPGWEGIGSDHLRPRPRRLERPASERPREDAPALLDGFRAMGALLRAHRAELLGPGGPLDAFKGLPLRFLRRDTLVYGGLLDALRTPGRLGDARAASRALEKILGPAASRDERERPLNEAELLALTALDVPRFHMRTDDTTLLADGMAPQAGHFALSGLDAARRRIAALSEADERAQAACVAQALEAAPRLAEAPAIAIAPAGRAPGAGAFRAEARRLGEIVARHAIPLAHGETWLTLASPAAASTQELALNAWGLYDGNAGSALALAALARLDGGGPFRARALAALAPLRRALESPALLAACAESRGGLGEGAPGAFYALTLAGRLLDEPALHAEARGLAAALAAREPGEGDVDDLLHGAAGRCLALLALHDARPDAALLASARACGERLLARRTLQTDGRAAWPGRDGPAGGAGFAHGQAGIAHALLRLARATNEGAFQEAALEALAYEAALTPPDGSRIFGWCNGAPGQALGWTEAPGAAPPGWLERALDETANRPAANLTVCCGLFGRVDVLLTAGRALDRPDLAEAAARLAAAGLAPLAGYVLGAERLMAGSFFRGLPGVVYQLARLVDPLAVPSVLRLDLPARAPRGSCP